MTATLPDFRRGLRWEQLKPAEMQTLSDAAAMVLSMVGPNMTAAGSSLTFGRQAQNPDLAGPPIQWGVVVEEPEDVDPFVIVRKVRYADVPVAAGVYQYAWATNDPTDVYGCLPMFGLKAVDYKGLYHDPDDGVPVAGQTQFVQIQRFGRTRIAVMSQSAGTQLFRVVGTADDHLLCLAYNSGGVAASSIVTVLKPFDLMVTPWNGAMRPDTGGTGAILYNYSNEDRRTADIVGSDEEPEVQRVIPSYREGDLIIAARIGGLSGRNPGFEFLSAHDSQWIDINQASRAWARIEQDA